MSSFSITKSFLTPPHKNSTSATPCTKDITGKSRQQGSDIDTIPSTKSTSTNILITSSTYLSSSSSKMGELLQHIPHIALKRTVGEMKRCWWLWVQRRTSFWDKGQGPFHPMSTIYCLEIVRFDSDQART